MKKVIYILMITAIFPLASCKKFLDVAPTDFLSPINYYSTETEVENALTGVYDPLGREAMYGRYLFTTLAYGNDEGLRSASATTTGLEVFNYTPSDGIVGNLWTSCYQGIDRANDLLANIDKPKMDETKRNRIRGEALFLRAYYYFLLADNWGDVPLKLSPTVSASDVDIKSSPKKEVFEQILKDMETAEPLVSTSTELKFSGRISKTTIAGIMARVCLTMAGSQVNDPDKLNDALKWAEKVVLSKEHSLNPDYKQIFINHSKDLYDVKESMWEIEFYGNGIGSYNETSWVGVWGGILASGPDLQTPGYGYGALYATNKLYNLYTDATDVRRDWNISPYYFTTTSPTNFTATQLYNRYPGKWRREYEVVTPKSKNVSSTNFPVLRYADVLLMLAEAENELNGPTQKAHDALNEVRARAHASEFKGATIITDKIVFRQIIQDERARELAFEALRDHDLKRWGIFISTMKDLSKSITASYPANLRFLALAGNNIADRHLYLPIPSLELSLNKAIKQNPDW